MDQSPAKLPDFSPHSQIKHPAEIQRRLFHCKKAAITTLITHILFRGDLKPFVFKGLATVEAEVTNGHDSNHRNQAIYHGNTATITTITDGFESSSGKEEFSVRKFAVGCCEKHAEASACQ